MKKKHQIIAKVSILLILTLAFYHSKAQIDSINYINSVETRIHSNILFHNTIDKVIGDSYFSLVIPRNDVFFNKNTTYTLYKHSFITHETDSFQLIFKGLPKEINNSHVGVFDYFYTGNTIYLLAYSHILLLKQNKNKDFHYVKAQQNKQNKYIQFYHLKKNLFIMAKYAHDKNTNEDVKLCLSGIKKNKVLKSKTFKIKGIRFAFFRNTRLDYSSKYTAIADITDYRIRILNNASFSIVDTIHLFNKFSSKENKDEKITKANITKSRKEYFRTPQIKKIAFINDSCLLVIKTDSLFYKTQSLSLDFWLINENGSRCYLSDYQVETSFSKQGEELINPKKPLLESLINSNAALFYDSKLIQVNTFLLFEEFKGMKYDDIIKAIRNEEKQKFRTKQYLQFYQMPLP